MSEIFFYEIEHVLDCEIEFQNIFISKVDCVH